MAAEMLDVTRSEEAGLLEPKLIALEAPADQQESKPRWKVGVFSLVCDVSTVYADTAQKAMEAVQNGMGAHAGVQGPTTVGMVAVQFDTPGTSDFIGQWVANIQNMQKLAQAGQPQERKQIVVPKIVLPPGVKV